MRRKSQSFNQILLQNNHILEQNITSKSIKLLNKIIQHFLRKFIKSKYKILSKFAAKLLRAQQKFVTYFATNYPIYPRHTIKNCRRFATSIGALLSKKILTIFYHNWCNKMQQVAHIFSRIERSKTYQFGSFSLRSSIKSELNFASSFASKLRKFGHEKPELIAAIFPSRWRKFN